VATVSGSGVVQQPQQAANLLLFIRRHTDVIQGLQLRVLSYNGLKMREAVEAMLAVISETLQIIYMFVSIFGRRQMIIQRKHTLQYHLGRLLQIEEYCIQPLKID
jgi:hypothetical protein